MDEIKRELKPNVSLGERGDNFIGLGLKKNAETVSTKNVIDLRGVVEENEENKEVTKDVKTKKKVEEIKKISNKKGKKEEKEDLKEDQKDNSENEEDEDYTDNEVKFNIIKLTSSTITNFTPETAIQPKKNPT